MKNTFLLLAIFFIGVHTLFSQINHWAWASSPTGYGYNDVNGSLCAADTLGNVYVTSAFSSATMKVGNTTLNRFDTSAVDNIYVAKYNSAGDVLWAKSAGGDQLAFARGIAVDPAGNVYLGGWFFGDSLVFENTVLHSQYLLVIIHASDFFIAKYDPNGNLLWAKTQDTTSQGLLLVNSIGCDAAGNLYAAGSVSAINGPLVYEGVTLIASTISNVDIALVKFDTGGHPVWGRNANATGNSSNALVMNTDAKGNSCITGYFENSATFGSNTLTGPADTSNFYVAKYDSAGNALWAQGTSSTGWAEGWVINTDKAGDVYVAGIFTDDSFSLGSITLHAQDGSRNNNAFLAKFNAGGAVDWLSPAGTAGSWGPNSVAFDPTGGVLVTGATSDLHLIVANDTLPCQGSGDIFLEAFNPATGFLQWLETYGPGGFHQDAYACNNQQGNIFLTGIFSSSILLGSYAFTNVDTPAYRTFIASEGYEAPNGLPVISGNDFLHSYPNPSAGAFTVAIPEGACTISIFNLMGQMVELRELQGPAAADFTLNNSGIYLIEVKTGEEVLTQKVVITR